MMYQCNIGLIQHLGVACRRQCSKHQDRSFLRDYTRLFQFHVHFDVHHQ